MNEQMELDMTYTYDENLYSCMHKDAYGSRPSVNDEFYTATPDRKQEIWDFTLQAVHQEIEHEEIERNDNEIMLEERIFDTIKVGAGDRETALRWILESVELDEYDIHHGVSYISYLFNISYEVASQFESALKSMALRFQGA